MIEPNRVTRVSTAVEGVLSEISVEKGDAVQRGQVVARLQSEVERASVMPDHWIYLPGPELAVHRVSEFKNFCESASPPDSVMTMRTVSISAADAVAGSEVASANGIIGHRSSDDERMRRAWSHSRSSTASS